MSLYESLEVFVGAGVLALMPAFGRDLPPGAAMSGSEFSAFLRSRGEGGPIGDVLDRLAHQIWLSQDTRGIPMHVAEEHARRLAPVIDACRPDTGLVKAALRGQVQGGLSAAAGQLAAGLMARARDLGLQELTPLSEDVCVFLLEQAFLQILADPRLLRGAAPAAGEFLTQHGKATEPVPAAVPGTGLAVATSTDSEMVALKERYGLSDKALARFSAIAEKQRTLPAREAWQIAELAQWLQDTRQQLLRPTNEPPEVRQMKAKAAEELLNGDFEAAMELLKEVRRSFRSARRRTEQRLEEELEQLRAELHQEALATADVAELAMARLDFQAAAELFEEAAEGTGRTDPAACLRFTLRRADALYYAGEERSDAALLRQSVGVYARAAELAGSNGEVKGLAAASQGLGNALLAIAEHEPSKALYEQACVAFRTALEVLSRETDPRVWGLARIGLGNALASMSEVETASALTLEQAAVAYKGALEVFTREAEPMRWAVTRLNMSTVLIRLGEIEDRRKNWLAAAAAIVPALEVFEAHGAAAQAGAARRSLKMLHSRWDMLEPPAAAE
ncbi:MAG: hypothetical protein KJZ80_12535 [Hyphomicrobiaceae bacterium]|nr:hypothetical protein [Hyphomicrobiaceae bacterium]